MVTKKNRMFRAHSDDIKKIIEDLKKWDIEIKDRNNGLENNGIIFEVQSDNTVYTIEIYEQEKCFMMEIDLNDPYVTSFDDIQMNLFGRVIWNWK